MKFVATAIIIAAATSVGAHAQTASGTYDPSNGQIVVTIGENIGVLGLEALEGDVLRPASLSDALGAAAQADSGTIAFFNPTGLASGTFDLGAIVTPGTPVANLGFSFTPINGDSTQGQLTVIPEPASLALLGLGGLTLLRRRRTA